MYLKRRVRHKDGKDHVYYTLTESLRMSPSRVVQRTVLHLGELNTTQVESWQRTVAAIHEDGHAEQLRLFTDREGAVPTNAADVVEVRLSSLAVRRPRRFGDCWVGCQMWEELGLCGFWEDVLSKQWGQVPWPKVLERLAVNRLIAPRSELFVHEKWYVQTAMELLLDTDGMVAEKNRLYRCLDRLLAHKGGAGTTPGRTVAGPVWGALRSVALRSEPILRARWRGLPGRDGVTRATVDRTANSWSLC